MILQGEESLMKQSLIPFLILFSGLGMAVGCGSSNKPATSGPTKVSGQPTTTPSGLQYWDISVGTGAAAVTGDTVKVHYTGWLTTGEKFDSSLDRNEPFSFPLGAGQVIRGWDEGVAGMKVGGKRQLRIPPELGYGPNGAGGVIPPSPPLKIK